MAPAKEGSTTTDLISNDKKPEATEWFSGKSNIFTRKIGRK
jgi:hypothetical protein